MEGVWGVRILVIPAGATRPLRGSASCVTCIGRRGDNTCVCRSELTFSQYVVLSGREMTSARRVLDFRLDLTANPGPSSSSRRYTCFCMPRLPSRLRRAFVVRGSVTSSRRCLGRGLEVDSRPPAGAAGRPFSWPSCMAVLFSVSRYPRPNHFSPCASGGPTVRSRIFYTLHRFTESFLQLALHPEEVTAG